MLFCLLRYMSTSIEYYAFLFHIPRLILIFLYFLPEKHDIVNDEIKYKPMRLLPINPFSSTSLMNPKHITICDVLMIKEVY